MSLNAWYEERKAAFEMENQILKDKLREGVNGVEWLVLQTMVTDDKKRSLEQWIFFLEMYKFTDIEAVMRDAILLKPKKFYKKYKCNWWISIDETLTYLSMLRKENYNRYFEFIQSLK